MSPFPNDALWHYSEKFTRNADLRQDLVVMAYQQDNRFGDRSNIRLLKNFMEYRAKEVATRNLARQIRRRPMRERVKEKAMECLARVEERPKWVVLFMVTDTLRVRMQPVHVNQGNCGQRGLK
jgi:hypothetical protein